MIYVCLHCNGNNPCNFCNSTGLVSLKLAYIQRYEMLADLIAQKIVEKTPVKTIEEQAKKYKVKPEDYAKMLKIEQSGMALLNLQQIPEPFLNALCDLTNIPDIKPYLALHRPN